MVIYIIISNEKCFHASVAQLVEQRIRNAWVRGSSPLGSFMKREEQAVALMFENIVVTACFSIFY